MYLKPFLLLLLLSLTLPAAASVDEPILPHLDDPELVDPWEPMNRKIFAFNEGLDKYLLRPVAKGYRFVMPDPAERGVTNFIENIYEFNTIFNSLLQGRGADAFDSGGRFIINSTFGLLGIFDVASAIGIERKPADFGQTLHTWGVDQGPFIMAPVIGPRTVRSGVGYLVDTYTSIPALSGETEWAYLFWTVEAIDIRAQLIKADQLISGDRYIFIRNVYLQQRETFLNGGVVSDEFSDYEEGGEFEEF